MNLAQSRRLVRLLEEAQPILPLYHDDDEPRPTTRAMVRYHEDDLAIRLWSTDDLLAHFPQRLYIDEDGVLYSWDDDMPTGEERVPCVVEWRYGDPNARNERYRRFLEVKPVSTTIGGTTS